MKIPGNLLARVCNYVVFQDLCLEKFIGLQSRWPFFSEIVTRSSCNDEFLTFENHEFLFIQSKLSWLITG